MDWADEHYVKLFTRDTVTWRSWPWQARALLTLLLRKVDAAGFFDIGTRDPALSIAIMVEMPREVVGPGLEALLADGTAELIGGKLLLPNYVAAQESRKTDKRKAADYREGKKAKARADAVAKPAEPLAGSVTGRHTASHGVTGGDPPALPCSALPCSEDSAREQPRAPDKPAGRGKPEKPPADPRHQPMVKALSDRFAEVTGSKYPFSPRDAKAVQQLLTLGLEPTVVSVWDRALKHTGFPTVRTLAELVTHFAHFVGAAARAGPDPNDGIKRTSRGRCAACGAGAIGRFANIDVCPTHLTAAEREGKRINPEAPWSVDLTGWASKTSQGAAA